MATWVCVGALGRPTTVCAYSDSADRGSSFGRDLITDRSSKCTSCSRSSSLHSSCVFLCVLRVSSCKLIMNTGHTRYNDIRIASPDCSGFGLDAPPNFQRVDGVACMHATLMTRKCAYSSCRAKAKRMRIVIEIDDGASFFSSLVPRVPPGGSDQVLRLQLPKSGPMGAGQ